MNNIIVSKATPEGISSICVVRVSGEGASKFVKPLIQKDLLVQRVNYTKLFGFNKNFIDYAIVIYFKAPKSLTGEDVVEFHIHGSEQISKRLINDLVFLGAKVAKPGEFLERRYLNGKISLIECEMINNKIFYNYESMFKMTIDHQKDIFLCVVKNSKFRINMLLISMEIAQFSENDPIYSDFVFIKKFLKKFKNLINILNSRLKKIQYLKSKFEVMIMGRRNVGKSTLFNKICYQYDSIVTNIPGTTTNNITKQIYFSTKKIILNDTAGLKIKTRNLIEKIGILRNINKIYKGNLILYMIDKFNLKKIFHNIPLNFFDKIKKNELIIIVNKCDIFGKSEGIYKIKNLLIIFLSAKNSVLISRIKCFISKIIDNEKLLFNNEMNYSNVKLLFDSCSLFYKEFCCNYEIIIAKLIDFQKKIFKMSGNYTNEIIINSFFRNFCMGK